MENLGLGFLLMGVGMVTVFAILLIVIFGSRGIISIINKVAPEEKKAAAHNEAFSEVDTATMAVLQAAVSKITGNKGKIIKATRI